MSNSRSPRAVRSMTIGISGMRRTLAVAASAARGFPARRPHEGRHWPHVRVRGCRVSGNARDDDAQLQLDEPALPHMNPRPSRKYPRLPAAVAVGTLATLALLAALALAAASASTSHAGWPPKEYLLMDKGPAGRHHVLVGRPNRHNWLLGGYGNDTIYGGEAGDVIW